MKSKEKKRAFDQLMDRVRSGLAASGFAFEKNGGTVWRLRGSYRDSIILQHATYHCNDVLPTVVCESLERLQAEERHNFYHPSALLRSGLISYLAEPGRGPRIGYNLDYGPEAVGDAIVEDFVEIAVPVFEEVSTLIEIYDPNLFRHKAFYESSVDEGVASLYFSRGRIDEGIRFLRGMDFRSYMIDPEMFLELHRKVANLEAIPPKWPPYGRLAEVFFRFGVDPRRLYSS